MSDSSAPKQCPKCGASIPAEAPQGLCPKCLLLEISVPTDAGQNPNSKSVPPMREELAAAFPQLEILELIGQGGMGFVFKARQPKLDRFVALKILPQSLAADPAFAERFSREGRLLARLNHPNIVTVHDFGQAKDFFYLLMEFVDGVNLRQAMKAGRFTPEQALAVVPKICEALQFAHNEGILHRDIKPENILLDTKGRVKIADFGIAKLVGVGQTFVSAGEGDFPVASVRNAGLDTDAGLESPANRQAGKPALPVTELTSAGKTLGTPNYMAPEQIKTPGAVDHRADIYSLGVVFYEMLTGELPLGRFAPPSQKSFADPRLDDVVLRALEKEPNRRTPSAGEVKTQIEIITGTPSQPTGRAAEVPIRVGESLYATEEYLATTWGAMKLHEGLGTLALYSDRLVLNRGSQSTEIQFRAVQRFSVMSYPFWLSPGGLRSILVEFGEAGHVRRLMLTPSKGMFSFVGDTNRRVAEWFVTIRDVITRAQGKPPSGSTAPELYGGFSSNGKLYATYAFLSLPVLLLGCLMFFIFSRAKLPSLLSFVPLLILPIAFALTIARMRRKQWLRENPLPQIENKRGKTESVRRDAQSSRAVTSPSPWMKWLGVGFILLGIPISIFGLAMLYLVLQDKSWNPAQSEAIVCFSAWIGTFILFVSGFILIKTSRVALGRWDNGLLTVTVLMTLMLGGGLIVEVTKQMGAKSATATIKSDYIGKTYFPRGDAIEIISVERFQDRMVVKGRYNLVSAESAQLALYITSTNISSVHEDPKQSMRISKGRGDFELTHPHLVPGRPHVNMYPVDGGQAFAEIYFGTRDEAFEESRFSLGSADKRDSATEAKPLENIRPTVDLVPAVVVRTTPVSGTREVSPGIVEISARFSKEMSDGSWSWGTAWENSMPEIVEGPQFNSDHRTCVIKVKLEPERTYACWLNSEKFHNFKDKAGNPAVPYLLIFQTGK